MIAFRSKLLLLGVALLFAAAAGRGHAACVSQQNITLQPGWNAIYIGVDPDIKDLATVFSGIPVASVWRWRPDQGGAQFIADPAEGLDSLTGWFGWYPAGKPEAFLSNLYRLEPNTAYLVKLDGTQSRQITVTGAPIYAPREWQTDAYTLTGITSDSSNPPSFAEYFAGSDAHQGQPFYKLGTDGRWTLVTSPATETLAPNRAYWIRTSGNSQWSGPLRVVLEQGESIDFGAALDRSRVVLRNLSGANGSFTLNRLGGSTLPLAYEQSDPVARTTSYPALGNQLVLAAAADTDTFLTLAPKRNEFTQNHHRQTFAISDEQGSCVLLDVSADSLQPITPPAGGTAPVSYAGLWAGVVSVDAVSQAQMRGSNVPGTTPLPTMREFHFRVLIHVDATGNVKLLKDVIQMWKDGTTRPSATDPTLRETATPGRYVLLTDPALIGQFSGATIRDNAEVGQRFSTVNYDFAGLALPVNGQFAPGQTLQASIVVGTNLSTNPFLHRYHPDHDNLDAQFATVQAEAYEVRRDQQFAIDAQEPGTRPTPEWGSSLLSGTFTETVTGLHRAPIVARGGFRLTRVSSIAVLNQ
jgi:hypothetical protein